MEYFRLFDIYELGFWRRTQYTWKHNDQGILIVK